MLADSPTASPGVGSGFASRNRDSIAGITRGICEGVYSPRRTYSLRSPGSTAVLAIVPGVPQPQPMSPSISFPVSIRVDAGKSKGPLKLIWRFFGADEPNYAYMTYGKELIAHQGELAPNRVYFRAHNLLTSGDGTPALKWGSTNAYTEDEEANPVYDWTIVDRIFDTYLERGVKPYVQIGFMPKALST